MNDVNFEIKKGHNSLHIKLGGFFSKKDVEDYLKEYNAVTEGLDYSITTLNFDAGEMKTMSADLTPMLEQCFELYKIQGYLAINTTIVNNIVLAMQVKRLCKKVGLDKMVIITK